MRPMSASFFVALVVAATAISVPRVTAGTHEDGIMAAAESGRHLTTMELYRLYKGKSWLWKDGVAYFRISKREFMGWSKPPGPEANYADGSWFLPGRGKLCFRATWRSTKWSVEDLNCFEHRQDDRGATFMRKLPDGEWWAFEDVPPNAWDEVHKVRRGNHAASGYKRNKAYVESNREPDPCLKSSRPQVLCKLFGP